MEDEDGVAALVHLVSFAMFRQLGFGSQLTDAG